MNANAEQFGEDVLACVDEINRMRRILAHIEATAFSQDTGMVTPEPGHG